jgi:DNA-binding response OmpR family regulator
VAENGASARKTQLVLISARSEVELAKKARESGADGYIVKESLCAASGERLLAKLRAFLEQGSWGPGLRSPAAPVGRLEAGGDWMTGPGT